MNETNEQQGTENREQKDCPQCADYLAGWKRAQADYANLKKETEREKAEFSKFANERLLSELIPAVDQFDTALAHAPQATDGPVQNWITGLKAVRSLWDAAFKDIGLERIDSSGEFDPLVHEAVSHEPSDTIPEGHVVRTVQTGWRLNGKLIRPAKVIISK